jgi:hypothetical protein
MITSRSGSGAIEAWIATDRDTERPVNVRDLYKASGVRARLPGVLQVRGTSCALALPAPEDPDVPAVAYHRGTAADAVREGLLYNIV